MSGEEKSGVSGEEYSGVNEKRRKVRSEEIVERLRMQNESNKIRVDAERREKKRDNKIEN